MRTFALIFLLLNLSISLNAQYTTYHVLEVVGEIYVNEQTSPVKRGDYIYSDDQVRFTNPKNKVIVRSKDDMHSLRSDKARKTSGGLIARVSNSIFSLDTIVSLKGKGDDYLETLGLYFAANLDVTAPRPFLIIDQLKYEIDEDELPVQENFLFVMTYQYKGETINKKLEYANAKLLIADYIYTVEGESISADDISDIKLWFFDMSSGSKHLIGHFLPVVAERATLVEQLVHLKSQFPKLNSEELLHQVFIPFVFEFYGKVDEEELKKVAGAE